MLYMQEEFVNVTEGHRNGGSPVFETFTDNRGELFRFCQREYGRCQSKVYIDTEDGAKLIGWTFLKRQRYDNCNETYLMETWITLHSGPPTDTREYHYA